MTKYLRMLTVLNVAAIAPLIAAEVPVFEADILPIFTRYCFNCHGKSSPQLGLDLRTARLTMRGSQNGPVIVKGSLEKSLLWQKVSTREMPLELFELKLSDAEIETIRRWIEAGAPSGESLELPPDVQEQFTRFETEIQPILTDHCVACHGAEDPESGLDLRSLESLVRGSKSGPVIVEGFSDKSVLIRKISSRMMPPPEMEDDLTDVEILSMTRWIDQGNFADFVDVKPLSHQASDSSAVSDADRQFWAFQQPVAAAPPQVAATDRIRTPVDHFILAELERHGLTFSPDASKHTLLRRASFDLTGLPPTPEQAQLFLNDDRTDAYERLIDRLLASPHYGERWGRHWLDAVGYVDTSDKDFDPNNPALSEGYWRYRDYVVSATNQDTPWDRFLIEQIAGDELVDWRNAETYTPEIIELLTATGYLRNVLDATDEDISNLPFDRYEALFMLMDRVSTSTMGMTLACARCHSHKFDPIPQTDYYRFLSLFTAAYNPSDWLPPKQRHLYGVSKSRETEIEHQKSRSTETLSKLEQRLKTLREPYRNQILDVKLKQIPEPERADVKVAVQTPEEERTELQQKIAEKYENKIAVTDTEIDAALNDIEETTSSDLRSKIQTVRSVLSTLRMDKLQALWDVGPAPVIRLLHRGDVDFAGPEVNPGFLTVLSATGRSDAVGSAAAVGDTTGLRLAFAEWLTSSDHPLTARVIVNRLWQHHFGKGIVDTPGNFGATGSRPTHPALLDWLAVEFMRQGWSAKRFHKMMMTSTVYRQTSAQMPNMEFTVQKENQSNLYSSIPGPHSVDPEARLLWRMNLQRLDAETLRDSVLSVSGQANFMMGGPPVMLKSTSDGLLTVSQQENRSTSSRRSIYLLARRSNPLTFLRVFDYPIIDVNCVRRSTSATPLQSLTMINSGFLMTSASRLADRVEALAGSDKRRRTKIEAAYQLTFARRPSLREAAAAEEHLQHLNQLYESTGLSAADVTKRSMENFVHMLLCSNEFLYVD
ncbi:MAG: PSD1 and planctomycete cytochrome C domain-containing protein [Fuerstiella sp.]|nr:PSD1 and planctomycete cytochrome C domain-containing protein [Fuerstiella sp.]